MIEFAFSRFEDAISVPSVEALLQHPRYNEIQRLEIRSEKDLTDLTTLPPNLENLVISQTFLWNIGAIPAGVRHLCLRDNRLKAIPDMSQCTGLEEVDLAHNDIPELGGPLPPNVRVMDVSYNRLQNVNYDLIPQTVARLDLSFNYLTAPPPSQAFVGRYIAVDHNEFDKFRSFVPPSHMPQPTGVGRVPPPSALPGPAVSVTKTEATRVYADAQNVHHHQIQNHAHACIQRLYKVPCTVRSNYLQEIIGRYRLYKQSRRTVMQRIFGRDPASYLPLQRWCDDRTRHSTLGVNFGDLLRQVWSVLCAQSNAAEIEKVLFQDLEDARDVCFTGRMTRIVNTLNGFVEGIQLSLASTQEQVQQEMATLMRAIETEKLTEAAAVERAEKLLKGFEVPPAQQSHWLRAVRDLFEEEEEEEPAEKPGEVEAKGGDRVEVATL